ncbi:MAG: VOC family protein [Pseudomonadota bacterium]
MQVLRIDHVHIEVSDREQAADWYGRVLGLKRHNDLTSWADDPMGPLTLQGGDGYPALSLFARSCEKPTRDNTIAFRVDANSFLKFLNRLQVLQLQTKTGGLLTRADVVDHALSWSLYFFDPDQNRIEVTTYDYDEVQQAGL